MISWWFGVTEHDWYEPGHRLRKKIVGGNQCCKEELLKTRQPFPKGPRTLEMETEKTRASLCGVKSEAALQQLSVVLSEPWTGHSTLFCVSGSWGVWLQRSEMPRLKTPGPDPSLDCG